jgi:hypothetical protein
MDDPAATLKKRGKKQRPQECCRQLKNSGSRAEGSEEKN